MGAGLKVKEEVSHNFTFEYLKYRKDLIETCARWSFNEWGHYIPHRTLEDFIRWREQYAIHDTELPFTLVAFSDDIPVGMCSLAKTRGILPELSPWLASLYVTPANRNRGIGALLEKKICGRAKELGYTDVYCFTSDEAVIPWYEKQGWHIREKSRLRDHEVTVLEKMLSHVGPPT